MKQSGDEAAYDVSQSGILPTDILWLWGEGTPALQRLPLTADHCCCMSYPQLVVDRKWTTTVEVAARLLSSTCTTDPEETSPDDDTGSTAVECRRRDS